MGAKTEIDLFTIEELRELKKKANDQGNIVLNLFWKRAYFRLADAADHLILMNECSLEKVSK